jgi:hypothetical protein
MATSKKNQPIPAQPVEPETPVFIPGQPAGMQPQFPEGPQTGEENESSVPIPPELDRLPTHPGGRHHDVNDHHHAVRPVNTNDVPAPKGKGGNDITK